MRQKRAGSGLGCRRSPAAPQKGFEELLQNLYEAVEGCLSMGVEPAQEGDRPRVIEIAV